MKDTLTLLAMTMLFVILSMGCTGQQDTAESQANEDVVQVGTPVLRHVVLFKFREGIDPEAITRVEQAFAELPAKIPEIRDFEWGINNSPEGLDKGFTHCFILTFHSEQDRAVYLPHPDHQAFGALLQDILEDVTVVDYWVN